MYNMSVRCLSIFLNIQLLVFTSQVEHYHAKPYHAAIVLIGGNGNLARKYLWQVLFDLYLKLNSSHDRSTQDYWIQECKLSKLSVFTGSLSDVKNASNELQHNFAACSPTKARYLANVKLYQLKRSTDFKDMCGAIAEEFYSFGSQSVKDIIVYLAVPTTAYISILSNIKNNCVFLGQNVSFKIVLEKPQGFDYDSAAHLTTELLKMYEEHELYNVDHYLFKGIVSSILPFRMANPQIEKMLNRDHVERVEIYLKESIGVDGRFAFYNDMGVIKDVFQSHLTQLLCLVSLDLPNIASVTSNEVDLSKARVLRQLMHARPSSIVVGQYSSYLQENIKSGVNDGTADSVPTYAAAVLRIQSPRWHNVPFILVSGKKMDTQSSYISIHFKENNICVSNCDVITHNVTSLPVNSSSCYHQHSKKARNQIVFQISHSKFNFPLISVSKSLGTLKYPNCLTKLTDHSIFSHVNSFYGDHHEEFFHATLVHNVNAYSDLIKDVLCGQHLNFVNSEQLLLSWLIWRNVCPFDVLRKSRIYEDGDPHSVLNIVLQGDRLDFATFLPSHHEPVVLQLEQTFSSQTQTPATYLGDRLVTGSTKEEVAYLLAQEIVNAADTTVARKGVFHIAFFGGSTPILLWQMLVQSFTRERLACVHIWQVDEKCVPSGSNSSNFFHLDHHFLQHVSMPWYNVHTMPVDVAGHLCHPELMGSQQYVESIRQAMPDTQLDIVVLGVGSDGHTASLFPHSAVLSSEPTTLIAVTEHAPGDFHRRMTMTFPLINRAKMVAVLVTGVEKREIIRELEDSRWAEMEHVKKYPVLGVRPINGTTSWFIDHDALYIGKDS